MSMQTNAQARIRSTRKAKAMAAGLLLAGMMAASLLPGVAPQARAADTFTVDQTIDTPDGNVGDGDCDVNPAVLGFQCTLRAAIQEANATPEPDLIRFAILDGGSGIKTIDVGSSGSGPLPPITQPVTIDGYTQPGSSPNTKAVGNDASLKIQLNGANVPGAGLEITSLSGNSVIKGLAINRFGTGVSINGDTVGNHIEGNFIGTDPTGTVDRGNNFDGVAIFGVASENVVGGTTPATRNVISGNDDTGVFVNGASGNRIEGNYVGTDRTGTKNLGNLDGGVVVSGQNNTVGDGTAAGSNTVASNAGDGIEVAGSTSFNNRISRNSIFSNGGLGIDLAGGTENASGATANDPGDADVGANGLQNKPVISSAKTSSTKTTITAKLASAPTTTTRSSSTPTPPATRTRSSSLERASPPAPPATPPSPSPPPRRSRSGRR